MPKTIAAGQEYPPSETASRTMKTGRSASRAIVSALGSWLRDTMTGYGGADARDPRLRRRAFPRLPAGAPRAGARRRLLGLARGDARRGRVADRRADSARVRRGLPRAARERLHGRRRVPLSRAGRG